MSGHINNVSRVSVSLKAIHMETDPQMISAYLIYLSQHAPVEDQASHNDLSLVITAVFVQSVVFSWHYAVIK